MMANRPWEPVIELEKDHFLLSTDPERLDLAVIHSFLGESYWPKAFPGEMVARSIGTRSALGLIRMAGRSRLRGRFLTLRTYAYVADVVVFMPFRDRGLGK